ncbi:hypothetical protein PYW08_004945 [Mythimna loreyi]|uniref:Uncharacterized protein n=1 Tax=Mythimna loreyi TaxID=667449 RepID=A0ACC2QG61_9NEOP|nr:hypothetical protein PYW08_004945 [Mythimna loreyi]
MAVLFATSLYPFTILFYSISYSLSIGRAEGASVGWSYGSNSGLGDNVFGFKAATPTFGDICKRFNFIRSQKLICLFCKGLDPACLMPSSTAQPLTTTTSTTELSTTVPSTTTAVPTTAPTTTPTTTTTTAAPAE